VLSTWPFALRLSFPLVSQDNEQVERGQLVDVLMPADALERMT
jgi:hypothetical protein